MQSITGVTIFPGPVKYQQISFAILVNNFFEKDKICGNFFF